MIQGIQPGRIIDLPGRLSQPYINGHRPFLPLFYLVNNLIAFFDFAFQPADVNKNVFCSVVRSDKAETL